MWQEAVDMIAQAASDTVPQVADLVTPPPRLVLFILADQLVSAALCSTLCRSHRSSSAASQQMISCCHSEYSLYHALILH